VGEVKRLTDVVRTILGEADPRCVEILYLDPGTQLSGGARYVVVSGSVEAEGTVVGEGGYIDADEVKAVERSVVIMVPRDCAEKVADLCPVTEVMTREVVWVPPNTPIIEAVKLMARLRISSVVVADEGRPLGILTDFDVKMLVANGVDLGKPVIDVASSPVVTVGPGATCLEALSIMASRGIKHLVVVDEAGRAIGVLTVRDVAYRLGIAQLYYVNKAMNAKTLDELRSTIANAAEYVKARSARFRDPLEVPDPANLLATYSLLLDAAILGASKAMGIALSGCGYAVTGSSGRLEQFLVTDRDTLVIGDDECLAKAAKIEDALDSIGLPRCPHGYDARKLAINVSKLDEVLDSWASDPAKHAVEISLLMDARPLTRSDPSAYEAIYSAKLMLVKRLRNNLDYLRHSLIYKPALRMLDRLPRYMDLKARALAPIEYPVRALAAIHGIAHPTSTLGRIRALEDVGAIPHDLARDLEAAWQFLLRLKVWLHATGSGRLDTSMLTKSERSSLIAALKAAQRLHEHIYSNYPL